MEKNKIMDNEKFNYGTQKLRIDGREYVLTVCANTLDNFSIQERVEL